MDAMRLLTEGKPRFTEVVSAVLREIQGVPKHDYLVRVNDRKYRATSDTKSTDSANTSVKALGSSNILGCHKLEN